MPSSFEERLLAVPPAPSSEGSLSLPVQPTPGSTTKKLLLVGGFLSLGAVGTSIVTAAVSRAPELTCDVLLSGGLTLLAAALGPTSVGIYRAGLRFCESRCGRALGVMLTVGGALAVGAIAGISADTGTGFLPPDLGGNGSFSFGNTTTNSTSSHCFGGLFTPSLGNAFNVGTGFAAGLLSTFAFVPGCAPAHRLR